MPRIFVGVAWPYANAPFHIGHLAGAYLPGDVFARFHRLLGDEVLMVSGSDMHGTPILVAAEAEGVTPEALASRNDAVNRAAFERLGFSFDLYTHTHTVVHEKTTQELFLKLLENGFVSRKTEEAAYCPKHQRFLPDRYLNGTCPYCGFEEARGDECDRCGRVLTPKQLGNPRCAICGTPAEFRPSEHFYIDLDKLQPKLAEFLGDKGYWRTPVLAVARNFLAEGLRSTPITRDLSWGIPIPLDGYAGKRFYVWFEAVIGYLSASREWAIRAGRADAWKKFWDPKESVRQYYFVGKDNVFHHTILWPGIVLGSGGLKPPYDVPANQWLLVEGLKVSKSRQSGKDVFVPSLLEHYPPDVIRFYAILLAPQNHDTEFNWDEFHQVSEEVLANQYGNLAQRVLSFARDKFGGAIPSPPEAGGTGSGVPFSERLTSAHERITAELTAVHLKEALDLILAEVREGNRRFHEAAPWKADETARARAVFEGLWLLKAAAIWLTPFLPFSSARLYRMLGYPDAPGSGDWNRVTEPPPAGQRLGEVTPLFPKEAARPADLAPVPLDIRSATVVDAIPHPTADRLLVLTLDAGDGAPRTIVAGIRGHYSTDELKGRHVAVLANLAPRTIRGIPSQGMVLAAEVGEKVILLRPPAGSAPGSRLVEMVEAAPTISHPQFEGERLVVGVVSRSGVDGRLTVDVGGDPLEVEGPAAVGENVIVRRPLNRPPALLRFPEGSLTTATPVEAGATVR